MDYQNTRDKKKMLESLQKASHERHCGCQEGLSGRLSLVLSHYAAKKPKWGHMEGNTERTAGLVDSHHQRPQLLSFQLRSQIMLGRDKLSLLSPVQVPRPPSPWAEYVQFGGHLFCSSGNCNNTLEVLAHVGTGCVYRNGHGSAAHNSNKKKLEAGKWVNKLWNIHTMEYDTGMKASELVLYVSACISLTKEKKFQNSKYSMIAFTVLRYGKQTTLTKQTYKHDDTKTDMGMTFTPFRPITSKKAEVIRKGTWRASTASTVFQFLRWVVGRSTCICYITLYTFVYTRNISHTNV